MIAAADDAKCVWREDKEWWRIAHGDVCLPLFDSVARPGKNNAHLERPARRMSSSSSTSRCIRNGLFLVFGCLGMSLSALAQVGPQTDDVPPRLEIISDVGTHCVQPQIAEIVRPEDKVSWRVTFRLVNACDTAQQSIVEVDAEGFSDWPVGATMQHAPQWTATLRPALEFTPYWTHGGVLNVVLTPHQSVDGWNYVRDAAGGSVVKVWIGTCPLSVGNDEIVGFYPRNFLRADPRLACVRKSLGEQLVQDKARGNSSAGAVEVFQGNGSLVEPQGVPVLSTSEQSLQRPEDSQAPPPPSAQTSSQSSAQLCANILSCSTDDLQALVRERDALRQEACGQSTCSNGNLKLMSQAEKELLAKGNRAREELKNRSTPNAGSFTQGLFQQSASQMNNPQAAQTLANQQASNSSQINQLTENGKARANAMMSNMLSAVSAAALASASSGGSGNGGAGTLPSSSGSVSQSVQTALMGSSAMSAVTGYGGSAGGASTPTQSGSSSKPGGTPVTASGAPCGSVASTSSKYVTSTNTGHPYYRYDYEVRNQCSSPIMITITWPGATEPVYLKGGQSRNWFCTDGFYSNTDCPGGKISWRAEWQ
ncbi:MAG TPA: hypothetical protein VJ859_10005 [Allosphingosinicella sp.]|nr:hypothetical protein [Allosphingosinicella sp.]